MSQVDHPLTKTRATVDQVMPGFGLAYLVSEDDRDWVVTRSTPGPGLATLRVGQQVQITLDQHDDFELVAAYETADAHA